MPLLGDPLLKINPRSSSFSSCTTRFFAQRIIWAVLSILVRTVTSRGDSGSPSRCMGSLGTGIPHSTSGQTGMYSTHRPRTSVRNRSSLWPPSKRTLSPNRHLLIPIRIFPFTPDPPWPVSSGDPAYVCAISVQWNFEPEYEMSWNIHYGAEEGTAGKPDHRVHGSHAWKAVIREHL
jgi:hypothetical protein